MEDAPGDARVLKGPGESSEGHRARLRLQAIWPRWLPPARLAWVVLLVLAIYGVIVLDGLGLTSLLALPVIAASVDLGFQRGRFASVRMPDAAVATGLFLTLILPPTVPLWVGATVAVCAITLRHAFRYRGRPLFNPAATGVLLAALFFGAAPAWWVAVGPYGFYLMLAAGVLLLLRTPTSWRLPVFFLGIYAVFAVVYHLLFGAATGGSVLLLTVLDPAILFLGLYMVTEPRTAPSAPYAHPIYAAVVGLGAAFLPLVLPSLGPIVALLGANGVSVALRRPPAGERQTASARTRRTHSPHRTTSGSSSGWTRRQRAAIGLFVLVAVGVLALATAAPSSTPAVLVGTPPGGGSGGGGSSSPAACSHDNPSIPSSTLSSLHKILGPSVILSYDSSTGVVVFYDPVNQVTVTETDLYEDYGYAEFNGDDYAVSGCSG